MFPAPIRTGLNLSKIVGGISKTLNVANQIIPLYMQARPIINNARGVFKIAKEFLNTPKQEGSTSKSTVKETSPRVEVQPQKKESISTFQSNGPVFFL